MISFLSKINKKVLILLIIALILSCANRTTKNNPFKKNDTISKSHSHLKNDSKGEFSIFLNKIDKISIPFNSKSLKKYITFKYSHDADGINSEVKLHHNKLNLTPNVKEYFSNSKRTSYKKTEKSEYLEGAYFYPVGKISKDSIVLIIFLYQDFEGIMPSLITQVNSYDYSSTLIDTLVLDRKFHFELLYSNDFEINEDRISIVEKIINYYDINDDLINQHEKPKIARNEIELSITNDGYFSCDKR